MTPAYIALGSNLRRPQHQLREAIIALAEFPRTKLEMVSSVYRSAAVGPGEQPDYLNAVARLATELSPTDLLEALQLVERNQGRTREIHWGARTLDLDLLLYGKMTIDTPTLTLPHPRMRLRHFVLYPLREISGADLALPDGTHIDTLLRDCPMNGLVKTRLRLLPKQPVQRTKHTMDLP
jgi:2-amino-4-hydroxy-6-hydroxymethyldihydropteridine diphosphokinase